MPCLIADLTVPGACPPSSHSLVPCSWLTTVSGWPLASWNLLLEVKGNRPTRSHGVVTLASSFFPPKKGLFLVFRGGTQPSSFLPPILKPCAFFQVYPRTQNDAPACLNTPSPSASILQAKSGRKRCNRGISGPAWG